MIRAGDIRDAMSVERVASLAYAAVDPAATERYAAMLPPRCRHAIF